MAKGKATNQQKEEKQAAAKVLKVLRKKHFKGISGTL